MGNVVPMDSKLLSNYWYMSWPSWPTHILTKIRANGGTNCTDVKGGEGDGTNCTYVKGGGG